MRARIAPDVSSCAAGGTLFLDEIGNLSLADAGQAARCTGIMTITRVGSDRPTEDRCSRDLCNEPDTRGPATPARFRQDLLYRINTIEIRVPPLRERVEDIPLIAAHFARLFARKYNKPQPASTRRHWSG